MNRLAIVSVVVGILGVAALLASLGTGNSRSGSESTTNASDEAIELDRAAAMLEDRVRDICRDSRWTSTAVRRAREVRLVVDEGYVAAIRDDRTARIYPDGVIAGDLVDALTSSCRLDLSLN